MAESFIQYKKSDYFDKKTLGFIPDYIIITIRAPESYGYNIPSGNAYRYWMHNYFLTHQPYYTSYNEEYPFYPQVFRRYNYNMPHFYPDLYSKNTFTHNYIEWLSGTNTDFSYSTSYVNYNFFLQEVMQYSKFYANYKNERKLRSVHNIGMWCTNQDNFDPTVMEYPYEVTVKYDFYKGGTFSIQDDGTGFNNVFASGFTHNELLEIKTNMIHPDFPSVWDGISAYNGVVMYFDPVTTDAQLICADEYYMTDFAFTAPMQRETPDILANTMNFFYEEDVLPIDSDTVSIKGNKGSATLDFNSTNQHDNTSQFISLSFVCGGEPPQQDCTITWITDNTLPLYNDYLPAGISEHSDDYPPVAMQGYEYYQKLEYNTDLTVNTWTIVSGELPPGLTLNPTTLEITGQPAFGCVIDGNNIPFNQWFLNSNEWRESDPYEFTFILKPDCNDNSTPFTIPVFPNWTPYKDALTDSADRFEQNVQEIKEKEVMIEKPSAFPDATSLCPKCDEDVELIKSSETIITQYFQYRHNDLIEKFREEATCSPFKLDNETEVQVKVVEELAPEKPDDGLKPIDKTGLCCDD